MVEKFNYDDYVPVNNSSYWPSPAPFAKPLSSEEIRWLSEHSEVEFTRDPQRNIEILAEYMGQETLSRESFVGCVEPGILAMRGTDGCWHAEERTQECQCSCHRQTTRMH